MRIFLGQIYGEAGVSFPFSQRMQVWVGEQVSALAVPRAEFISRYGIDFSLGVRISARRNSKQADVLGPTVFKKSKDVEYTLMLPYDLIMSTPDGCRLAIELIIDGVSEICTRANIDCPGLHTAKGRIVEEVCSNPAMLKTRWPL